MTHFAKMNCISIAITKKNYMLACLLAMTSVNVCRLCTNVDKTINLFSRAGMRNEWSSRISAMLDITIEDDERVSPYVCYKCTCRLSLLEKAIEDLLRHSGAGHIVIECTDEEENQVNLPNVSKSTINN